MLLRYAHRVGDGLADRVVEDVADEVSTSGLRSTTAMVCDCSTPAGR
jgi:hypothetical protein